MKKLLLAISLVGTTFTLFGDSKSDQGQKYYYKGCFFVSENNHLSAIDCFNKALALCPNESNAWEARGASYFSIGNYAQSIIDFTQAITIYPLNIKAYVGRALSYAKIGNMIAFKTDMITAARLGSPEGQAMAKAWGWSW